MLYERRCVSWLLELLPRLVDRCGDVWLVDPQRRNADTFLAAAERDWTCDTAAETSFPDVRVHRLRKRPA